MLWPSVEVVADQAKVSRVAVMANQMKTANVFVITAIPICGAHGAYSKLTEKCICTDGYSGDKCNIAPAANACDAVSCGEYGICNVKTGACVCKGGYTGTHCEIAQTGLNAESLSLNDEDLSFLLSASTVQNSTITPAKEGDLIGKTDVQNGGNIDLNNTENRNVYGLYYNDSFNYRPGPQANGSEGSKSVISINNKSDGNVYGMWANMVEYIDNASGGSYALAFG